MGQGVGGGWIFWRKPTVEAMKRSSKSLQYVVFTSFLFVQSWDLLDFPSAEKKSGSFKKILLQQKFANDGIDFCFQKLVKQRMQKGHLSLKLDVPILASNSSVTASMASQISHGMWRQVVDFQTQKFAASRRHVLQLCQLWMCQSYSVNKGDGFCIHFLKNRRSGFRNAKRNCWPTGQFHAVLFAEGWNN